MRKRPAFITTALLLSGCGYMLGPQPVPGIQTVHVPVFQTDSFRRNMDYLLTEAVQQEIRTRSPYRLADEDTADTILQGRIVEIRKDVLSETRFDDPRELQLLVGVRVAWIDRRSGRVLQERVFPVNRGLALQSAQVSFAPELGHSMATAQTESVRVLAARIVDMMENPW